MMVDATQTLIVSGGDAKYFPLLEELVMSIRALPEGESQPVALLDGGFTEAQLARCAQLGVLVKDPGWPSEKAKRKAQGREFLKINLAKPCLDQLFPDYDVLMWVDGDTWFQTPEAIEVSTRIAHQKKLAIVTQATRYDTRPTPFRKKLFGWVELRNILHKNAKRAGMSRKQVWQMAGRPVLNAGVYAIHRDAPHWEIWRSYQNQCIAGRGRLFTSDQLALGLAVYGHELAWEPLPEVCNYMWEWMFDEAANNGQGQLVEALYPHKPVSVVHLVSLDEMRDDATVTVPVKTLAGGSVDLSLRYSVWASQLAEIAA